jgi:hypothetical protein
MPGKDDPREIILDANRLVDQMLNTEPLKDVAMTFAVALAVCADRMGGTTDQRMQFAKLMAMVVANTIRILEAANAPRP